MRVSYAWRQPEAALGSAGNKKPQQGKSLLRQIIFLVSRNSLKNSDLPPFSLRKHKETKPLSASVGAAAAGGDMGGHMFIVFIA
jgi:hypothetical protein